MCLSSLHQVVEDDGSDMVTAEDMDGKLQRVSLLALDGDRPEPGEWLVVHSGYAIERISAQEARAVISDLRAVRTGVQPDPAEQVASAVDRGTTEPVKGEMQP